MEKNHIFKFVNNRKYSPYNNFYEARELKKGDSFGELALTSKILNKRQSSVVTKEDTDFGVLDWDSFDRILSNESFHF